MPQGPKRKKRRVFVKLIPGKEAKNRGGGGKNDEAKVRKNIFFKPTSFFGSKIEGMKRKMIWDHRGNEGGIGGRCKKKPGKGGGQLIHNLRNTKKDKTAN